MTIENNQYDVPVEVKQRITYCYMTHKHEEFKQLLEGDIINQIRIKGYSLLEHSIVNKLDKWTVDLLNWGAQPTVDTLCVVVSRNLVVWVTFLLNKGIKPNSECLDAAIQQGNLKLVKLFVEEYGISIHEVSSITESGYSITPLIKAILYYKNEEIMDYLLESGANLDVDLKFVEVLYAHCKHFGLWETMDKHKHVLSAEGLAYWESQKDKETRKN